MCIMSTESIGLRKQPYALGPVRLYRDTDGKDISKEWFVIFGNMLVHVRVR